MDRGEAGGAQFGGDGGARGGPCLARHAAKETVRRFYCADDVEELLAKPRAGRPSRLDECKPHLHRRWNEGCTNVLEPHREITAAGYRGGYSTVCDYLTPFRPLRAAPAAKPGTPEVRTITSWMMRRPDTLDTDERVGLKQVLAACPHLDATSGHVTAFAEMLTGRHSEQLDAWMTAVDAADLPYLRSFVTGLRQDHTACRVPKVGHMV